MSRVRQRRLPAGAWEECDRPSCPDPVRIHLEGRNVCEGWICRYWALRQALEEAKALLRRTVFDGLTFAAVLFCAGVVFGLVLHKLLFGIG